MAFKSTIQGEKPPAQYYYQRYPLVMHRGKHPKVESLQVNSKADEESAIASGYSTVVPKIPDPPPEAPVLTVEERLEEMEESFAGVRESMDQLTERIAALEAAPKAITTPVAPKPVTPPIATPVLPAAPPTPPKASAPPPAPKPETKGN